jgi:hypothetical protein
MPDGVLVVLLSVLMNGKTLPEKILSLLFRWSGQQPVEDRIIDRFLSSYCPAGFTVRSEWQAVGEDRLLFIFFEKSTL